MIVGEISNIKNAGNLDIITYKLEQYDETFEEIKDLVNDLKPLKSPTKDKKEKYLNKIKLLYNLISKKGNKKELDKLDHIETLIKTTDFLNLNTELKEKIKNSLIWCNKKYEKYLDS